MSCCGLFKSKAKTKPVSQPQAQPDPPIVRAPLQHATAPPRHPVAAEPQRMQKRQETVMSGEQVQDYCLNVPWRTTQVVDLSRSAPFRFYTPGERRF